MKQLRFSQVDSGLGFYLLLAILGAISAVGLWATAIMEHEGHVVTGMSNQVVWGMPHIFAIFLIVAASGALNIASIASVFGKKFYKPLAPLSALLAVALLSGGLAVLVLDLGKPDRLTVAMTQMNFKSIFSWNIILYNGFLAIVLAYMWVMLDKPMQKYSTAVGTLAFVWRLVLTTGTGSIFGFLVARQGYDAAIMAPMFVVMSFAYGLAFFYIVLSATYRMTGRELGKVMINRLRLLLAIFIAGAFYFTAVQHLTNLYATEHHGFEAFILRDGGIYTTVFWLGQVLIGYLIPFALLLYPATAQSRCGVAFASFLVIIGGFAQMYVTVIGGQAYPLQLFPGYEVSSSFYDGVVADYSPSSYETLLGFLGISLALIIVTIAVRNLRLLPVSLADAAIDPHHK
ncbi:molybdopterin oxidoreductase [Ectothiorhodospiraceae bacterium BW-2]|nr:molybdopterin oxidoreductase [Ectothiorhodospiraceae bacterium BW-2]